MPDKKYLITIPGQEESALWGEDRYNANKDALLKDHPDAEIAEIESYSAEDAQDNDMYLINIDGKSEPAYWNASRFNANKDALLRDYPNAQIQRVRGVDYWGEQRADLERRMEEHNNQYGAFLSDYEAKQLSERNARVGTGGKMHSMYTDYLFENAGEYSKRNKEREDLRKEYYNNPSVKKEREGDLMSVKEMSSKLEEEANARYKQAIADYQAEGGNIASRGADVTISGKAETQMYNSALNMLKKAQETLEAPSKYDESNGFVNFMKGAGHTFGSVDFWSAGLTEIQDNAKARAAFDRLKKELGTTDISKLTEEQIDHALSPAEKAMVLAFTKKALADYKRSEDMSLGYQSGKSAAESLGFMAQFLMTGAVTSAAAKGATSGMARWLAKNLGNAFVSKAVPGIAKFGAKALQHMGKFALGTTRSLVDAAVRTGMTTTLGRSISEQALPNVFEGTLPEASEYVLKGLGDAFIENWSEAYGGVLSKLVSTPATTLFGKWGQVIARSPMMKGLERAGFNGYLTEIGEEFFGNAMRSVLNVNPDALKDFTTVDSLIVTATSFLPMSLIGGAVSVGQYKYAGKDLENKAAELRVALQNAGLNMDEIDALVDYTQQLSPKMLSERFTPLINRLATASGSLRNAKEVMRAASGFAKAVARYQAVEGGYQTEENNAKNEYRNQLQQQMNGEQFWTTRELNATNEQGEAYTQDEVRVATLQDGTRAFILGQEGDQIQYIDEQGNHKFLNAQDLPSQVVNDRTMSLDQFLSEDVIARRSEIERARMFEQRETQKSEIRAAHPIGSAINLGTRVEPLEGVIAQYGADYVVVQTQDATNPFRTVSYEQVGQAFNTPIRVLSDEQMASEEAAILEAETAEREAAEAETNEEMDTADMSIESAAELEEEAAPTIIPQNEDGSVNEAKFLEDNPEAYVEWNDAERQDGGADSLEQLQMIVPVYQAQYEQAAKAWSENAANPTARREAKNAMAEWQDKINRINNLIAKYTAPAEGEAMAQAQAETEQRYAEQMVMSRERINEWRRTLGLNEDQLVVFESEEDVRQSQHLSDAAKRETLKVLQNGLTPGWYNTETNKVFLYLPHISSQEMLDKTIAHEVVTHFGLANFMGEEAYNELMDKVWNAMSDSKRFEYLNYEGVRNIKDADKRRRTAAEEYMAEVAEAINLDQATPEQKSVWLRIADFFRNLFKKKMNVEFSDKDIAEIIRGNYQQLRSNAEQNATYNDKTWRQENIETFRAEASQRAAEQVESSEANTQTNETEAQNNDAAPEVLPDGTNMWSTKTYREGGRDYLAMWLQSDESISEEERKYILDTMDFMYNAAEGLAEKYSAFGAWSEADVVRDAKGDPIMSVIKANGDYAMNLDFSLVCKKRRALNALLNKMIKDGRFDGMVLREKEIARINQILQKHGFEVACALCFVDAKRYRVASVATQFTSMYNDLVKSLIPKGSGYEVLWYNYMQEPNQSEEDARKNPDTVISNLPDEALDWTRIDKILKRAEGKKQLNVEEKIAKLLKSGAKYRRLASASDFISDQGFELVTQNNPELLKLYNAKKGTGGPKASLGDVQYLNNIAKSQAFSIEKAYKVGGVRIQSFSDYMPHMFFDYMQMMAELAGKRLPAHAYTKEPAFARLFGMTGMKINLSLVPRVDMDGIAPGLDAEGNYTWAVEYVDEEGRTIATQTFPPEIAFEMQQDPRYSGNVGAIAVGISDEHILKMLGDPNIHFIIPYHKSSLNPDVAKMAKIDQYSDYTNYQTEKLDPSHPNAPKGKLTATQKKAEIAKRAFDFYGSLAQTNDPKQTAADYLAHCKEVGLIPKFLQFANNENYYKLLVDFNTYDFVTGEYAPQGAVTMTFPDNMLELIEEGLVEDQQLDDKLNAEISEVAEEVYEEIGQTMYRFIGEKGAANLDKAEEATIRLDNLAIARQMEDAGKDALAIKLATGWERGADGKWRYEVPDGYIKENPKLERYEWVTDEGEKRYEYVGKLSDIYEDKELFLAYPSLRDTTIEINPYMIDGESGSYNSLINLIKLVSNYTRFVEEHSERYNQLVKKLDDLLENVSDEEVMSVLNEWDNTDEGRELQELSEKERGHFEVGFPDYERKGSARRILIHEIQHAIQHEEGFAKGTSVRRKDYLKYAGEVEARNAEKRKDYTPEQRRNSLASETEDVAREDQIILMDGLGVSEMGTNMFKTRITPEQDKAYMDAVEAGDMEAAQRMVLEAAKLAMPNTKVVDEDGNPKVVYHQTNAKIYVNRETGENWDDLGWREKMEWDERDDWEDYWEEQDFNAFSRVNARTTNEFDGFFFAPKYDEYHEYGDRTIAAFVNIQNPASREDYNIDSTQNDAGRNERIRLQEAGFDGVIRFDGEEVDEYIAFEPSQIKSAEPVTYDNDGNVIPLSERFNEEKEDIRFKTANNNQAIFVSNAAKAVEGVKMEKATPEQWLKMIEKNGGLKAGEDKWMGLSDWLKASDKKTLTKQEVLDFVNEHMIQIEEVHYDANAEERASDAHSNIVGVLQNKFNDYVAEYHEEHGYDDEYDDPASKYAIEKLREEMEDTFPYTIELVYGNEVYVTFDYEEEDEMVKWAEKTGVNYIPGENPINSTRLDYTTDSLENKHEIALIVPNIESWNEGDDIHFGDAGDGRAVAWIRFGETKKLLGTTEVEGKKKFNWAKVLVIDEIQSKRHQEGREKGYKSKDYWPLRTSYLEKKTVYESLYDEMAAKYGEEFTDAPNEEFAKRVLDAEDYERIMKAKADFDAAADAYIPMRNAIPDAPFEKNWHELAMKRMLRYAAENGYDVVAWTKGDQQAERYNIGGVISEIKATKYPRGYEVVSFGKNGSVVHNEVFADESAMAGVYGKEMAQRIIESVDALEPSETATISGDNLRVGGEGMKGFYDKILPAFMNKYGKKWGVKVEDINFPGLEGGLTMHSVPVTEEMKESVMEGQTMFKTKHPQEFAKQFMQDATNEFYETYNTFAPASVVYANSRKMIEDALGFDSGKMPDWVYNAVKEEAKTSPAYLVTIEDKKEDGSVETRRRILIFANDSVDMSSIVDWMLFHENTHAILQDVEDKVSMLKLGEWLLKNDNKHVRKIADWVKATYEEDAWAEEMLCEYVGKMLAIGRGQWALNLVPEEYKPILNEIYGKFGYRPEQEDGRRDGEISRDIRELQMRNSELEGTDSNKTLFRTGISPEVRREMDVISATAIVNGNYMKAPNGKDSKLTPEQWAMVRTKRFLNWAGDWMNDPENASVVLDVETGEPLVLYHGTPRAGFTEFKSGWFTTSKDDAISYSGDRKGRMFDPNEKYEPETLTAGDFRLGYMTFDSEEDRAAFLAEHPTAESAMSESEYENARIQAEDEEYDALTERKPELQKIWDAYREYERDHFVDTTIGEILNNPEAYTEDDLRRAVLAYDSNAVFDSIDELETTEERKSALVDSLNYMNEDAKENGAEGILDMVVATRVPRNGEGVKHNDLGNRTYEVYARIERPYEIDANGRGSEFESGDIYQSVKDALADEQYDGVIIRNWRVGRHQQLGDVVVPKNGKQVKLTSNENPTESEDIRFKFIGEKGAANLDKFEEATTRLDNLAIAREMESAGKDAKTIKLATGWEKGADDKWRYEIVDGHIIENPKLERHEWFVDGEKRYEYVGKLSDVYDSPELYRAYPFLKETTIEINPYSVDGESGFYSPAADLIKVVSNYTKWVEEHSDRFNYLSKKLDDALENVRDEDVMQFLEDYAKTEEGKELNDLGARERGHFEAGFAPYEMEGSARRTLIHEIQHAIQRKEGFAKGTNVRNSDYRAYAGEVESRNAERRMNMSAEERRNTLASETEDVAREDQIILMEGLGVADNIVAESTLEESTGEDVRFKTRTKPAPTKTQDVYKLMRLGADGKLYPLFIGSAEPIELGTWYDAESPNLGDLTKLASGVHLVNNETGEAMTLDEFKAQHPEITIKGKRPNVAAINWATENGARWIEIEDKATAQRRYEGESRSYYNLGINGSGQVGQFAMRPGWHAGSLPTMRQIGKGKAKNLRDDSFVWVKGRIPADVEYQSEADANPDKDIPTHIPTDGFYMKATNANAKASQADKMGWYVAGSFIADEIISDAEARSVIDSWNAEHPDAQVEHDYPRESGREFDPARGGLVEKEGTTLFKTTGTPTEQVVKDGLVLSVEDFTDLAGNIFSAMPEDVRRKVVENAARTDYDLKKATLQMSASLAEKRELTDEEIELAKMVAQKVEDAVLASGVEMTRPFTTNEALWMLYQSTNPTSEYDLIGNARKAVVANNLGMSQSQQEAENRTSEEVMFKRVYVPEQAVSAADAYMQAITYFGNRLNEAFVDQFDSVDQMMKAIEDATGKKAESWEDIRIILNQSASKGLAKLKEVERELIQKMWNAVNELAKTGVSHERISRYVILKHGLERNEVFAARDARQDYEAEYRDEIRRIKNDTTLTAAQKNQQMADAKKVLDDHLLDIDNKVDAKYLENRKTDYSGIKAMFADYPGLMSEDNYSTAEEYRTARRKSRVLKYRKLSDAEMQAEMECDAFEVGRDSLIKGLWSSINNLTQGTLKMQHEYGMLSNDAYKSLTGMFKYYVPLRGFADNTGEDLYDYYGHNVSDGYAPAIIGAKGRKSEAESPFGWMAAMAATAVVSGEKNLAKQALYYFTMNRKANDLLKVADVWYVESPTDPGKFYPEYPPKADPNKTPAENAQQYADWEEQMEDMARQGKAVKKANKLDVAEIVNFGKRDVPEHIIKVNINGEEKQLILNANPRAAQAINGLLNIESNPDYQKVLGKVLRWMSQVSTRWNPEFWMTNISRDTITAFASIGIKEDKNYNEAFRRNWVDAWKIVKLLPKLKDGSLGSGRLEDLLREAVENGVQTGYSHIKSMEEWDSDMEKYISDLNKDEKKVVRGTKNFLDRVQTFSEAMELVSRFATYLTSREMGRDVAQSVADAKEVTVNFNRKGSGMRITLEEAKKLKWADGTPIFSEKWKGFKRFKGLVSIAYVSGISAMAPFGRKYMMFFNAAIQGLNMWIQLGRQGHGKQIATLAGSAFALGMLNSVVAGMLDGDDDDYQQSISDYERRTNLMLGANGFYLKVALPQEIRCFYGLGDILYNYMAGNYHHKDKPMEIVKTIGNQLMDILPINPLGGWAEFIPSMAKGVTEAGLAIPFFGEVIKGTNMNFAGIPIRDEKPWLSEDERKSLPKYTFAGEGTWNWLVSVAELANRISGGTEYDAGKVQLDPARLQHYIEQGTGGVGRFIGNVASTIEAIADPEKEVEVSQIPFLNKLLTVADERGQNKLTNQQYYYYKGVAERSEMRYDKYLKANDKEHAKKERSSDDFKIMKIYFKYEARQDAYKERLKRARTTEEEKEIKAMRDANRKEFLNELAENRLR